MNASGNVPQRVLRGAPSKRRARPSPSRVLAMLAMVACLAVGSALPAAAQEIGRSDPERLAVGVKGGAGMAGLRGDAVSETDRRVSYVAGAFLTYRINRRFAFQPEVLFTGKGADAPSPLPGLVEEAPLEDENDQYQLSYVEVPLLAKVYLPLRAGVRPALVGGPVIAANISGNYAGESIEDHVAPLDYGLALGAEIDIGTGPRLVNLAVRYTLGLANVFDTAGDPEARNGAFVFTVGFGL